MLFLKGSHFIPVNFGDFPRITGIEPLAHTKNNAGAAVEQHQQFIGCRIYGQAFDLALFFDLGERFFQNNTGI